MLSVVYIVVLMIHGHTNIKFTWILTNVLRNECVSGVVGGR